MAEEIKANSDTKEQVEEFLKQLTELELEKKALQERIKDLKDDYKEEGLPVALIVSIFKRVQKNKQKSDGERFEEEAIQEWLEESKVVDDCILRLS